MLKDVHRFLTCHTPGVPLRANPSKFFFSDTWCPTSPYYGPTRYSRITHYFPFPLFLYRRLEFCFNNPPLYRYHPPTALFLRYDTLFVRPKILGRNIYHLTEVKDFFSPFDSPLFLSCFSLILAILGGYDFLPFPGLGFSISVLGPLTSFQTVCLPIVSSPLPAPPPFSPPSSMDLIKSRSSSLPVSWPLHCGTGREFPR